MIVRLMGEGQYRVDDGLREQLNELDARLDQIFALVQREGERLADDDLSPSDAIVPPSDMTLEETRQLMTAEGFIPDIPGE